MNTTLPSLSDDLLRLVEDQLANNEWASGEELVAYFVEAGLAEEQAREAISYRNRYLVNLYREGFTPIRNPGVVLRYNPHKRDFEPE